MNFGKTFLAALLAVIVAGFVTSMLWTLLFVGMMAAMGSGKTVLVEKGSVLKFDLETMTDTPDDGGVFGSRKLNLLTLSMSETRSGSLLKTLQAIEAAATDERIEGLMIDQGVSAGVSMAHNEEVRAAIERFRESGKFVVAYNEAYGHGSYYLASVADKVWLNPVGDVAWAGLAGGMVSFRRLAEKLNIEPVVIRHGKFKSAVEPYLLDKMSPENRQQQERMLNSTWNVILEGVSKSRGVEIPALQLLADELAIDSPQAAVEMRMVDGLKYRSEVNDEIKSLTKFEEKEDPRFVSIADYASQLTPKSASSKNKIAVVYAEGTIMPKGYGGGIDDESMAGKLKRAAKDDAVKAVVLRVNSPGGSGLTSDIIWKEIETLREKKPVVVSMGSYAASGGYYISAPADAIYADRTTLTGSIGVFGLLFSGEKMYEKIGVGFDAAKTNAHSDLGAGFYSPVGTLMFRAPSDSERAWLQKSIESFYGTFVGRVAAGRNMTTEAVDEIGQGRVWTGTDAQQIGLVDGFGGLAEAISLAAERVGVADDFRIAEIVDTPTGLDAFFAGLSAQVRASVLRAELGPLYDEYIYLRQTLDQQGVQARMPYRIEVR